MEKVILGDIMHEINLDKYELRTDLVIDHFPGKESCSNYTKKVINKDIYVEEIGINDQEEAKTFRKKEGIYKTTNRNDGIHSHPTADRFIINSDSVHGRSS